MLEHEFTIEEEHGECERCGGMLVPLGQLGALLYLRCRACGGQCSREVAVPVPVAA